MTFNPIDIAGCFFWLDGRCNTRNGLDHSKEYMENLVNKWITGPTSFEDYRPSNSCGTWDGNFLKLSNYMRFARPYTKDFTIEAIAKFYKNSSVGLYYTYVRTNNLRKGYGLSFSYRQPNMYIGTAFAPSSNDSYVLLGKTNLTINTPYYLVLKYEYNTEKVFLYVNGTIEAEGKTKLVQPTNNYACVGAQGNPSVGVLYDGLSIGMLKAYNKCLSDDDIVNNYNTLKIDFNLP